MDDNVINILEKRVSALELQVLPQENSEELSRNQCITDLLLQTHTMIASALSCRDNIVSILDRMPRLNEYLNPNYTDTDLEIEARRQYVLELYPELKKTAELINKFESLRLFADSQSIPQVTNLSDKLDQLTITNLSIYEESKDVTNKVLASLQQYNDITISIRTLFAELDYSVTELEAALQPKVKMEE